MAPDPVDPPEPAGAAAAPEPPGGPDVPKVATCALIYVAGLPIRADSDKTFKGVTRRVQQVSELETSGDTFSIEESSTSYGGSVSTLNRTRGGTKAPVLDMYEHVWNGGFINKWNDQNAFLKAARILFTTLRFLRIYRYFKRGSERSSRGMAQLIFVEVMMALMVLYGAIVVLSAVSLAKQFVDDKKAEVEKGSSPVPGTSSPPATSGTTAAAATSGPTTGTSGDGSPAGTFVKVGLLLSAFGVLPLMKRSLESMGAALFAAENYISLGIGTDTEVNQLATLIDQVRQSHEYENIALVTYSFGTLVALDTVFPTSGEPSGAVKDLTTLVTIGCPYDFALSANGSWLANRYRRSSGKAGKPIDIQWMNIYAAADLLGSNFRDDDQPGDATVGVPTRTENDPSPNLVLPGNRVSGSGVTPSLLDLLQLYGLTTHASYWGGDSEGDLGVFRTLIPKLYKETPVLTS